MTPASLYRPASELVLRRVGDEAILVPVRNRVGDLDSVFTLNEIALRVWTLLDGQHTLEAIAATVAEEYDVSFDVAIADVSELIATLQEARLVEPVREAV